MCELKVNSSDIKRRMLVLHHSLYRLPRSDAFLARNDVCGKAKNSLVKILDKT